MKHLAIAIFRATLGFMSILLVPFMVLLSGFITIGNKLYDEIIGQSEWHSD